VPLGHKSTPAANSGDVHDVCGATVPLTFSLNVFGELEPQFVTLIA
jgi:hypothetical protein